MLWYADNSELNGLRGATINDILLFGGIAFPRDIELNIQEKVESVKAKYGPRRAPIKWNFRDLKDVYQKQNRKELFEKLLKSSRDWRAEIFDEISDFDLTIIISVLESYSSESKTIKQKKDDLARYVFTNSLMRFGLLAKELHAKRPQIVLDWPDKGISTPFDVEYASAYNNGTTKNKKVPYQCGPLCALNFCDHAAYANMRHSTLLQLSDLFVGATREFVECALGKKGPGQGIDCLKKVSHRFRGYPHRILGWGINICSGDSKFKEKIRHAISNILIS